MTSGGIGNGAGDETLEVQGRPVVLWRQRSVGARGPTLLLLHGAGGNHHSFDELTAALPGRDLIVPALPGRCGSSGPPLESVEEGAVWIAELVDRLDVTQVVGAGHSYGGALALEYALLEACRGGIGRLAGLVLMATGARLRVHPGVLEVMRAAAAAGKTVELSSIYQATTSPELIARAEAVHARTPAASELCDWLSADRFDRLAALGTLSLPTLVLGGTDDLLTPPKYARFLAEHIAGAQLELLPGGGHMLPIEHAAPTAARLVPFLDRLAPLPAD